MATKSLYQLSSDVIVTLKTSEQDTHSFSINVRLLVQFIGLLLFSIFTITLGSLLFFRELELNRKLEERILNLEIQRLLTIAPLPAPVPTVPQKAATPTETVLNEPTVGPRIQDLETDCEAGTCTVHLSLIPSHTGIAQGELLIVLEAEVPRIGGTNAQAGIRKRYFLYPGNESRDELSEEQIGTLAKKPFRFARALQTSAEFNIGDVVLPKAVTIYLYDPENNLIHREVSPIEMETTHVQ